MTNLSYHKEVMLAQQIIHIINTACLRIFYWYQAILNFPRGNSPEDLGKTAAGKWLSLFSKINAHSFITKGSPFALKCHGKRLL